MSHSLPHKETTYSDYQVHPYTFVFPDIQHQLSEDLSFTLKIEKRYMNESH